MKRFDNRTVARAIVQRTRGRTHGPATRLMSPSDFGEILKPFVFLDLFDYEGAPFSAGLHAHSGIATLTYIAEGAVSYIDPDNVTGTLAADKAGWGKPLPAGQGRGIALCLGFGSFIAQVVKISLDEYGNVNPMHLWCVVDCGIAVNPDTVRAQMESGIVFGLSAALYGEITLKYGRVEQANFRDYRVLRINEAPQIEVYVAKSSEAPGGIGEPGTSCVMPVLTNAVYAVTGKRIRKLPVG
jgi:CO/xanthine dehydrogenase Mo-binding subunit